MSSNKEPMSSNQETYGDWNDCPQGELSRMVRRLDASKTSARNKKLVRTGMLSMLLVASGVVVSGSLLTPSSFTYGGITCAQCKSHFAEYNGYMTGSALLEDMGLVKSMATHLASCPICRPRFNEMYPGVLQDVASISTRPVVRNSFPLLAVSHRPAFY